MHHPGIDRGDVMTTWASPRISGSLTAGDVTTPNPHQMSLDDSPPPSPRRPSPVIRCHPLSPAVTPAVVIPRRHQPSGTWT
jgi:hypothetical protein